MEKDFFNKQNYIWLAVGALTLIVGFWFLGQGPANNPKSLTIAPLLLVGAYLIIIPIGILFGGKKENSGD